MKPQPIILLYASHDGHTYQITQHLEAYLIAQNQNVIIYNVKEQIPPNFMIEDAAFVLVISPIRYGYHLPAIEAFLKEAKSFLKNEKIGLASINLTARKSNKNTAETNPYYKKWLKRHHISPAVRAVFAGRLDYQRYKWWDRQMIRLIMKITGGPTDSYTQIDYTDWAAVEALGAEIVKKVIRKQEVA